ncbi:MAG TPA: GspH/FimT family pseudopilin [Longimicrobiaceae bacterium]|nr:GspH/FimT family pseudopilin [Longimicrobiaceae bacterium]
MPECTPPQARSREAGYTLIEMLTVCVIVGIVSLMALPRLDVARYRSEQGMKHLGSVMAMAQRAAVAKQHNVVIAFDVAGRRLRVHSDENNNGVMDAGEPVRYEPLASGVTFSRGSAPQLSMGAGPVTFAKVQAGIPAVTFSRNGTAGEEGGFYVTTIRATKASTYTSDARAVVIERATGRPTWYRYTGSAWERDF